MNDHELGPDETFAYCQLHGPQQQPMTPVERQRQRKLTLDALAPGPDRTGIRAWEALMLARTPEAWAQLLAGEPVPKDQLDHHTLRRARSRRL